MTERYQDYGGGVHDRWETVVVNDCPRCKQPVGAKCVNPQTGRPAHVACIARMKVVTA